MIVARRWLEALLDRPLDARDVADRLTLHTAPVDAVVPLHQDLVDVVIARVLEVKKHPDADRLTLCLVDRGGGGAPVEVVCGAPNVQAGKTYPYAPVGAVLPGGLKLERKKIRGVESNGMLCSAKELGLGEVVKLPEIPGGKAVSRLEHAYPPNRLTDLRGVVDGVEIRLEDPEGAPRYMIAVIRGVRVGKSPAWLGGRLAAVGQRPINNVVDATNYILFELNQPLHAFDLAKLRGPAVVVRRATPGEKIVTLDGVTRTLTPDMTAI